MTTAPGAAPAPAPCWDHSASTVPARPAARPGAIHHLTRLRENAAEKRSVLMGHR